MKIHVEFDMDLPYLQEELTEQEIRDWVRFSLRDNGSLSMSNPLAREELQPIFGTVKVEVKP